MSGSLNKVMLIGNLGKDPEIKTFEGGNSLARFPIATSESYTNRQTNERVTQTEWHTIVLRRGLAEVAEKYLHKGDKVFIEGKIKTRSWENDRGERQYATEVHADNMTMLGGRRDDDGSSSGNSMRGPAEPADLSRNSEEEDDLPF
ncbi:MAG: single-stranded DNA-binding protein [Owenweeksia sp.]